jgi:hypothetical protein
MKSKCEKIKELITMSPKQIDAHINGRFVPRMASKCEKAAEKYTRKKYTQGQDFHFGGLDFKAGAQALLRHAKKNQKTRIFEGAMGNSYEIVVQISKLEQWVKGEK